MYLFPSLNFSEFVGGRTWCPYPQGAIDEAGLLSRDWRENAQSGVAPQPVFMRYKLL